MSEEIDFREWEVRIVEGSTSEVQKILNQWRHEYYLNFLLMKFGRSEAQIMLARRKF